MLRRDILISCRAVTHDVLLADAWRTSSTHTVIPRPPEPVPGRALSTPVTSANSVPCCAPRRHPPQALDTVRAASWPRPELVKQWQTKRHYRLGEGASIHPACCGRSGNPLGQATPNAKPPAIGISKWTGGWITASSVPAPARRCVFGGRVLVTKTDCDEMAAGLRSMPNSVSAGCFHDPVDPQYPWKSAPVSN